MRFQSPASLVLLLALSLVSACSKDKQESPTPPPPAPAATSASAAPKKPGVMGTATIKGVVRFTGKAPEMKVPKARKGDEHCASKEIVHDAVLVADGGLEGAFVRIAEGSVEGEYPAPASPVVVEQLDCVYSPRIQGAIAGQTIEVKNADQVLHNVHTYKGGETWFNSSHPKGSAPIQKPLEDPGIIRFGCDVHPWMRAFVIVSSHPFFAVSQKGGAFTIEKVPAGKYAVEAWHPIYGLKKAELQVAKGKVAELDFSYDGTEAPPEENKNELKDLF